jgi:hypothetical protein
MIDGHLTLLPKFLAVGRAEAFAIHGGERCAEWADYIEGFRMTAVEIAIGLPAAVLAIGAVLLSHVR